MIKKYISRFPHAFRGISHAVKNDFGFRTQIYLGSVVAVIITIVFQPLAAWEFLFLILACTIVLITELQNSALEAALDRLHPELHDDIKYSKDMAAGAVLIAGIFLLTVIIVIGYGKFM